MLYLLTAVGFAIAAVLVLQVAAPEQLPARLRAPVPEDAPEFIAALDRRGGPPPRRRGPPTRRRRGY